MSGKLLKNIKPNFCFEDERGSLVQLVREGYKQFNVIFSKKGVERGNHFHKYNTETFYIIKGYVQVRTEKNDDCEVEEYKDGDMFCIEPYIKHSFIYLEDTWLASMYSEGVELENGTKDIWCE